MHRALSTQRRGIPGECWGALPALYRGPLGQPVDAHWFFVAWGSGKDGTMEYRATDDVARQRGAGRVRGTRSRYTIRTTFAG